MFYVFSFFLGGLFNEYISINNCEDIILKNELADSNKVTIEFVCKFDEEVYLQTLFGEPPQVAIWLEDLNSDSLINVFTTHRSFNNDWAGKIECEIALPIWNSKFNHLKNKKKLVDARTFATPKNSVVKVISHIPINTKLKYFIEVNVSGDYNNAYPYWSDNGTPDSEGNGQPSIIYGGEINTKLKNISKPQLIGCTSQFQLVDTINVDVSGITTAKELIKSTIVRFVRD